MNVSVVVPILDAARTLPSCLAALERLDPAPAEIVLIDNGSSDGSLDLARAFARRDAGRTRVLEEELRGPGLARNRGIREATGEIVAFTDADCSPEPDWLAHLLRPFSDPAVGSVAGGIVFTPPSSLVEGFSALYTLRAPESPGRYRLWTPASGGFPTANLAVRRSILLSLGGFDPAFRSEAEDHDLCARLYARGFEVALAPQAKVAHRHRLSLSAMLRQAYRFGRGHPHLLRRHGPSLLWIDLPRRTLSWSGSPLPLWIDFASADKKLMALAAFGLAQPWLWLLVPVYLAHLTVSARKRARRAGWPATFGSGAGLGALLLLKSSAMTAGRWWGSLRHRCLCL